MIVAVQNNGTAYGIVYLLHILTVVIAFAAGWVHPRFDDMTVYGEEGARGDFAGDEGVRKGLAAVKAKSTLQISLPALILAGFFGIALVLMSAEDAYDFSQTWISLAFLLWFAMIGITVGLMMPAQRRLAAGETDDVEKRLSMSTGIVHLLFLLMLLDMIFKPGFP